MKDMQSVKPELFWRWPPLAAKAHVYRKGEAISLCGKWMFTGVDDGEFVPGGNHGQAVDCKDCTRRADRLLERFAKSEGVKSA